MQMSDALRCLGLGFRPTDDPASAEDECVDTADTRSAPLARISATSSPKGIVFPDKPLIGIDLMSFVFQPDLEVLLGGVHPPSDTLTSEGSAHVVVLAVDGEIAPGPYGPRKGSLLDAAPSQWEVTTVWGTAGKVGKAGKATRGGWLPQERA